jgi:hypothetical protein
LRQLDALAVAVVGDQDLLERDAEASRLVDQQHNLHVARNSLDSQILIDDTNRSP